MSIFWHTHPAKVDRILRSVLSLEANQLVVTDKHFTKPFPARSAPVSRPTPIPCIEGWSRATALSTLVLHEGLDGDAVKLGRLVMDLAL
jgi:hypothetical protein